MNRQPAPARGEHPEVVKLRRANEQNQRIINSLVRKLARADAEKIIEGCKGEGIIFDNEKEEVERLALLDESGQQFFLNTYRKNYKRREPDPAQPAFPGVARFARPVSTAPGGGEVEDEPLTPQESNMVANIMAQQKIPVEKMGEAIKLMRNRNGTARK